MPQLFIDLDGVLADFDRHYEALFGPRPDKDAPNDVFWGPVTRHPDFFASMPLMPDALALWTGAQRLTGATPTILTGVTSHYPGCEIQKRQWVAQHMGAHVQMIGCRSKDKCLHGQPGDVLIDDWLRWRKRWIRMGGHFVLHTDAASSLAAVRAILQPQGA